MAWMVPYELGLDTSTPRPQAASTDPPEGWASDRLALASASLPNGHTRFESWKRKDAGYEHVVVTEHWIENIDAALLDSFDRKARDAGLQLVHVEHVDLKFTLTYRTYDATLSVYRLSRTGIGMTLVISVPHELQTVPPVVEAISQRPFVASLARQHRIQQVTRRGSTFTFEFDGTTDEHGPAIRCPMLMPAKAPDRRVCYSAADGRVVYVRSSHAFEVLDPGAMHE